MKTMKILLGLAIVVGSVSAAWAATPPNVGAGPLRLEGNNRDNGTGYVSLVPIQQQRTFDLSDANDLADLQIFGSPGAIGNEDTWGVFNLIGITSGKLDNNLVDFADVPIGYYDWTQVNVMTNDTALVGIFWGGQDREVTIDFDGDFSVLTDDVQFELWAVDKANVDLTPGWGGPEYVAARRTAANRYDGWVAAGDATKVKLLSGSSTYFEFAGSINTGTVPVTFDGLTTSYWDIDENDASGQWNASWGQTAAFVDNDGNSADLYFTWNINSGTSGWTANSNDDGGVVVIPEPMTIGALGMAMAGLGGYLRRRRR